MEVSPKTILLAKALGFAVVCAATTMIHYEAHSRGENFGHPLTFCALAGVCGAFALGQVVTYFAVFLGSMLYYQLGIGSVEASHRPIAECFAMFESFVFAGIAALSYVAGVWLRNRAVSFIDEVP